MSATRIAKPARSRPFELRASDGFGPLTTQPPQPGRPASHGFCLDATTFWRSATAPIESSRPVASTVPAKTGTRALREFRSDSE